MKFYNNTPISRELTTFIAGNMLYVVVKITPCRGDEVIVEFMDGQEGFVFGILTEPPTDGPYCSVDGENLDLATEAYSSRMYKVIGKFQIDDKDVKFLKL